MSTNQTGLSKIVRKKLILQFGYIPALLLLFRQKRRRKRLERIRGYK